MSDKELFSLLDEKQDTFCKTEKDEALDYLNKNFSGISKEEDIENSACNENLPSFLTELFDENKPKEEDTSISSSELIFSRPPVKAKAPEIIHSMEDREVKTLYGEKVILEKKETPFTDTLDDIDKANGLTSEEIKKAKAETLEKAEKFVELEKEEEEVVLPEKEEEPGKSPVFIEEEDDYDLPPIKNKEPRRKRTKLPKQEKTKVIPGFIDEICKKLDIDLKFKWLVSLLFTIICSPVFIPALLLCAVVYLSAIGAVLLVAVLLFSATAAAFVSGAVELVYGVITLFTSVPAGLIEIGLGTILFSLATAIFALNHEYTFGKLPELAKKITVFSKDKIINIKIKLYGGRV